MLCCFMNWHGNVFFVCCVVLVFISGVLHVVTCILCSVVACCVALRCVVLRCVVAGCVVSCRVMCVLCRVVLCCGL